VPSTRNFFAAGLANVIVGGEALAALDAGAGGPRKLAESLSSWFRWNSRADSSPARAEAAELRARRARLSSLPIEQEGAAVRQLMHDLWASYRPTLSARINLDLGSMDMLYVRHAGLLTTVERRTLDRRSSAESTC
jgi:hypothetical protein